MGHCRSLQRWPKSTNPRWCGRKCLDAPLPVRSDAGSIHAVANSCFSGGSAPSVRALAVHMSSDPRVLRRESLATFLGLDLLFFGVASGC